jgi:hypothetical protein
MTRVKCFHLTTIRFLACAQAHTTIIRAHARAHTVSSYQNFQPCPKKRHRPCRRAGRRIQTRRSGVHGKGVFAVQDIAEGETMIEYTGEIISWQEAQDRHPHDPKDPNHTFYFHVDEDRVIDAKYGGNSSRWINHSCDPNCEADEQDGPHLHQGAAQHRSRRRAQLRLRPDHRRALHPKLKAEYPCWCGAKLPRHLLAPKRAAARH